MEKHELHHLETQMNELIKRMNSLSEGRDLEDVLTIIYRPGFTTVAEYALMKGIAEAMNEQARSLLALKRAFVSAASKVGTNPQLPPAFHLA